jgi:hypothetical protein
MPGDLAQSILAATSLTALLAGNIARECPIKQKFSTFLPTETQIFHFF